MVWQYPGPLLLAAPVRARSTGREDQGRTRALEAVEETKDVQSIATTEQRIDPPTERRTHVNPRNQARSVLFHTCALLRTPNRCRGGGGGDRTGSGQGVVGNCPVEVSLSFSSQSRLVG